MQAFAENEQHIGQYCKQACYNDTKSTNVSVRNWLTILKQALNQLNNLDEKHIN